MSEQLKKFRKEVEKDLLEQRRLGVLISDAAIKAALLDVGMKDYAENMSVADCADLLIKLYNMKQ